jgi:hypothetical protein
MTLLRTTPFRLAAALALSGAHHVSASSILAKDTDKHDDDGSPRSSSNGKGAPGCCDRGEGILLLIVPVVLFLLVAQCVEEGPRAWCAGLCDCSEERCAKLEEKSRKRQEEVLCNHYVLLHGIQLASNAGEKRTQRRQRETGRDAGRRRMETHAGAGVARIDPQGEGGGQQLWPARRSCSHQPTEGGWGSNSARDVRGSCSHQPTGGGSGAAALTRAQELLASTHRGRVGDQL